MQDSTEGKPPKVNRFAQQQLPGWRPMITPTFAIIAFAVVAVFSFAVGIVCLIQNSKTIHIEQRYDNRCELNSQCVITLNVPKEMKGDIILKYKLTKFYQNHRRFMESRSDAQLKGEYVDFAGMKDDCYKSRSINDSETPANWLLPCGISALSVFNDTFKVQKSDISMSETGISWPSDKQYLYKNLSERYTTGQKWLENDPLFGGQTNEHFIVWMRVSALPTIVKPFSICKECTIPAGNLNVSITNNYPTSSFHGTKSVILTNQTWMGPKNYFLGIAFIVVGICFVLAILGLVIAHIVKPRKLGDPRLVVELIAKREEEYTQRWKKLFCITVPSVMA